MKITRGYKTELDPTATQREYFVRACGTARYVYNWALADRTAMYEEQIAALKAGDEEKANTLRREQSFFSQCKRWIAYRDENTPWAKEVGAGVALWELKNLDTAYRNFFRRVKQGGGAPGFPRFKSRRHGVGGFHASTIRVESCRVRVPIIGWVKLKERDYLPTDGVAVHRVTVRERAGRWYIAITADIEVPEPVAVGDDLAVHLGVRMLATVSDGRQFANAHPLEQSLRRLRRAQQKLARCEDGSKRRQGAKLRVAILHERVANLRREQHHQASAAITGRHASEQDRPRRLAVEDWDVKAMLEADHANGRAAKRRLSRAIADSAMADLGRMIRYKATWGGSEVIEGERFYASSRTCSRCGWVWAEMTLGHLVFRCQQCGLALDREENAVRNVQGLLADEGELSVDGRSPETENGRGGKVSPSSGGTRL